MRIGKQPSFIWVSYEKPSSSHCVMSYLRWGCRRNLKLITLMLSSHLDGKTQGLTTTGFFCPQVSWLSLPLLTRASVNPPKGWRVFALIPLSIEQTLLGVRLIPSSAGAWVRAIEDGSEWLWFVGSSCFVNRVVLILKILSFFSSSARANTAIYQ